MRELRRGAPAQFLQNIGLGASEIVSVQNIAEFSTNTLNTIDSEIMT